MDKLQAWSQPGGLIERPGQYSGACELWCYTDKFSYLSGENVSIMVYANTDEYDVEIIRDGARPATVFTQTGLPGRQHPGSRQSRYRNSLTSCYV